MEDKISKKRKKSSNVEVSIHDFWHVVKVSGISNKMKVKKRKILGKKILLNTQNIFFHVPIIPFKTRVLPAVCTMLNTQ